VSYANMIPPRRAVLEAAYAHHAEMTGLKSASLSELLVALDFVCDDGEGGRDVLTDTRDAALEEAAKVVARFPGVGTWDQDELAAAIRALKTVTPPTE
jgi:hypothetical protein